MPEDSVVEEAIEAIRAVHSDTSVPLEDTLDRLELLESEIQDLIAAVREDLQNG